MKRGCALRIGEQLSAQFCKHHGHLTYPFISVSARIVDIYARIDIKIT
jgi:hypothetical protein